MRIRFIPAELAWDSYEGVTQVLWGRKFQQKFLLYRNPLTGQICWNYIFEQKSAQCACHMYLFTSPARSSYSAVLCHYWSGGSATFWDFLGPFCVRSCLLIILIKCLKGHKSQGLLFNVKIKRSHSLIEWVSDKVTYCAVCGQLKIVESQQKCPNITV